MFAQAAWSTESSKVSLRTNGLYEASGVALWLRTGSYSVGSGRDVNPGEISCESLTKFKNDFFAKNAGIKATIRRGQAKKQRQKDRLLWPTTMVVGCETLEQSEQYSADGGLNLAGGHFILWAWYLALWEALQASETRLFSSSRKF